MIIRPFQKYRKLVFFLKLNNLVRHPIMIGFFYENFMEFFRPIDVTKRNHANFEGTFFYHLEKILKIVNFSRGWRYVTDIKNIARIESPPLISPKFNINSP